MILRQTRHYHVISGSHAARCGTLALDLYVGGCPVGHDSSCKSPLISRCFRAGIVAVCSVHTIDQVVRCHNGHRLCIFGCDFKTFQIDLTQCTLGQDGIGAHTVILLIVACEVFDRGSAARYLLYTECHGSRHHTGKQRILGIVFKVSSAERISVDVHTRCQPQCYVEQFHLMADHFADSLDQFYIPALCQKCSDRNCGTELIIGCSAFFLRFAEESAFQCRQEIARYDLSVVYLYSLFRRRPAGPSTRAMVVTFHGSSEAHGDVSAAAPGTEIPAEPSALPCALPGSPVARSAS